MCSSDLLESSKEFASLKQKEVSSEIKSLKIIVRLLSEEDINTRQLPADTTGVVITEIASDSSLTGHMQVNDVIVEVKKIKIHDLKQLNDILKKSFDKDENTLVFTIYSKQNQRRYIGIKLK